MLVGLALFLVGAAVVVLGYHLDVSVAVVGALALLFVGLGASLKRRTRPPAN